MPRPRGSTKQREHRRRLVTGGGRMIGYIRVSTAEQGSNGYSLDGQEERLQAAAEREGVELVEVVCDVKSGAKQRDGLDEAWARVVAGEAEGILFPKLDRLGRSQLHLASLVEQARDQGLSLLSSDEGWQVYRGELRNEALPFLIALAQVERERISRRTREGLAVVKRSGKRLGRPVVNPTEAGERAVQLRRQGLTIQQVTDTINAEGHRTAKGGEFAVSTVYETIRRLDPDALPEGGHREEEHPPREASHSQAPLIARRQSHGFGRT